MYPPGFGLLKTAPARFFKKPSTQTDKPRQTPRLTLPHMAAVAGRRFPQPRGVQRLSR